MTVGTQKFNCKIELSKTGGISISIRDLSQPSQIYKQVLLQGDSLVIKTNKAQSSATITQTEESLTTEVKNAQGSTKIEQGPEAVTVTCKTFTVDAENITLKSKQDTKCTATGEWSVSSSKSFKVATQADCEIKSGTAMTLDAKGNATVKSAATLAMQGTNLESSAKTSLGIKSDGSLNAEGGAVSVKGNMRASLESPSTTVGNTMTTIQGQIVSISGSMIKLG